MLSVKRVEVSDEPPAEKKPWFNRQFDRALIDAVVHHHKVDEEQEDTAAAWDTTEEEVKGTKFLRIVVEPTFV
jgi:hypothetical protein